MNAYATAKLPGGQMHTSLLVFQAWLEERRSRLLSGNLALRTGVSMPAT